MTSREATQHKLASRTPATRLVRTLAVAISIGCVAAACSGDPVPADSEAATAEASSDPAPNESSNSVDSDADSQVDSDGVETSDTNFNPMGAVEAASIIPASASASQVELMTPGDGREPVTFRLDAPNAGVVQLEMTANYWNAFPDSTLELIRVDDEISSHALTLYLGPEQWLYRFRVDGTWVADPANPARVGAEMEEGNSVMLVGEALPLATPQFGAPQGVVETLTIESDILGRTIPAVLYLPPGTSADDSSDELPLLVLLHGFGQPATDWVEAASIATMMDNLIADGSIEPFAIVMPSAEMSNYLGNRARHIVDEVIPAVAERHPIRGASGSGDAPAMAIGGFSMGGNGAVRLAYDRPDLFGLSMPISMAGPCGTLCPDEYDSSYPDGFEAEFAMWAGVDDELRLDENHDAFADYLTDRGIDFTDTRIDQPGHRLSGHSIRFVRTIAGDVLIRADEFFTR